MARVCALVMGLVLLMATPGLAAADTRSATNQKAVETVIARAMSQRGVPFAYGGGGASGPSAGTVAVSEPDEAETDAAALDLVPGLNLPAATPNVASPAPAPRVEVVGFEPPQAAVDGIQESGSSCPARRASSTRSARR